MNNVVYTGRQLIFGVIVTGDKCIRVRSTVINKKGPQNLSPVCVDTGHQFINGVVDTDTKFIVGVFDTGDKTVDTFTTCLSFYRHHWGKTMLDVNNQTLKPIYEKKLEFKNLVSVYL